MSLRGEFANMWETLKEEYKKVEFSDKILDLVSIAGVVLFLAGLVILDLQHQFNVINIIFIMYPLFLSGMTAAFRMKRRDKPEETPKLLKEWLIIMGVYLVIVFITIILAIVIING